jgi:drug/metabolite transporter (DMT)-like permease
VNLAVSLVAALAAAAGFAASAVLQQESATTVPEERTLSPTLLLALVRRRKWLLGMGSLLAAFGLQALALAYGPVALAQPVIVVELAFAIPLGMWRGRRRAGRREWMGIAFVMGGVALFLAVAVPAGGASNPAGSRWLVALIAVGAIVAAVLVAGARVSGPIRALFFGAAAGIAFGVLAVLTKAVVHQFGAGLGTAFSGWQLWLLITVGIAAFVISQSAYQAGPLAYSMPMTDLLEPAVAVVLGDVLLDENVRLTAGVLAVQVLAAVVACAGIVLLATSPVVLSIHEGR